MQKLSPGAAGVAVALAVVALALSLCSLFRVDAYTSAGMVVIPLLAVVAGAEEYRRKSRTH